MNKVFKVIWNEARNAYVVVSEIAKNRGSKSCSTKKLLAMLIAMGVMTCASFDVLAAPPSVAATAKSQYVVFFDETAGLINGQEDTIDGHKYIYDATNKYWVRAGYKLTVEENGKLHTPLSAHGKAADVAYIGDGDTGSILQSVTSMVSASGTVTNMGESLSRITASAFAGVSHGGGAAVAGDWSYIIQDSSWQGYENYQDGYVDLIDQANGMPKGFVTVGEKLKWDDTKQAYTYNGKPVDYSNVYVIDGKIGVFTNQSGSDFYKGTVFGKNNEILMTVKDGDHFYSYWAAEVTDPSATMQSYRLAEYKKDLAVLVENDNKLSRDDIKEVTLDTSKANSATISLLRNGDKAVDGAITVTSGGGTEGSDTFVKISNGTANQTFATGSKVEAIGTTEATTGIKINGQEYTIKSGSVVSVAKDAANKTTTITVDGNATTITDTDTTYTAGDGIKINVGAISVSKNLTGMQSIQGAGEGKISFDGANVKVNNTTFSENSVVVGGGTDGKTPVTINGTDGVVSGLHNTNIGYTDFATRGNAATEEQLKKVMDAGWKFTTDSGTKTTVTVGEAGNEVKFNGDSANIEVTNTGNNIKVALNKNLTVDSVKAGSSFMSATGIGYGDKAYITSSGLNANGQTITNVKAGEAETDAVNVGQLNAVKETANKGWKLKTNNGNVSDVKPGDEVEFDGDDNIKVSNAGNKVSFKLNNKLTGIESITGVGGGSISFSGGNVTINNNVTFGSNGQIHNVTAGTASTDAVNVGQLNAAVQAGNTDTHIKPGEYGVGADNKVNMDVVDKTGTKINTVTITDVAKASDLGNVNNINNDLKNSNGTTTVVDAVNNLNQKLDNKVGDLQYSKVDKGDIADGDSTTTAIGKLDQKLNDVAATAAKQHTTVSGSGNIVVEDPTINADGGKNYNVKLADDINVNSVTANTFKADKTIMDKDGLKVGEKVSVTENAVTAGKTSISDEGVKVGDKTYISDKGLNANGQNITNVADGKVEKDSKDAINGGQLFDTETKINNRIDGVENQVISNSNRIGQLSSRVNKVGAGAAALAALHPMDFDPDDKLTFSAGYGNYAGQNAAAIGAYYRPDEKVMFSVGGTVGNGENMVNAGISFSLDRTNHVSNSRTALAREVIDLRGQLAEMGAKMAKMEKAFGMLDESKTKLFPDIPANHWAYEYIAKLAGNGYVEGYPDGSFGGDRLMTRYEFAAMLYRAIENGAALEEKIIKEFEPELGRIRVDRISGEDGDRDKIERVRVNDTKGERDHYGNKLAK